MVSGLSGSSVCSTPKENQPHRPESFDPKPSRRLCDDPLRMSHCAAIISPRAHSKAPAVSFANRGRCGLDNSCNTPRTAWVFALRLRGGGGGRSPSSCNLYTMLSREAQNPWLRVQKPKSQQPQTLSPGKQQTDHYEYYYLYILSDL